MSDRARAAGDRSGDQREFFWQGPSTETVPPSKWRYVSMVGIAIGLGVLFFWLHQPLSILVVAAALLFFVTHIGQPGPVHHYRLTADQLSVDNQEHRLQDFKSFWIVPAAPTPLLYLDRIGRLSLPLMVPLRPADVDAIRSLLKVQLPESTKRTEPLADLLARMTGIGL